MFRLLQQLKTSVRPWASSPLVKVGMWLAALVAVAGLVQSLAWLAGSDWNILSQSGGRGVLLVIALGLLLAMMASDRRPAASYGFFVGKGWARLLFGGFAAGVLAYALYCAAALALGGYRLHTDSLSVGRLSLVVIGALSAFPVALTQQIIFSGYLLGMFRERYGRIVAVLVPAAMFAVVYRIDDPALLFSTRPKPLLVGMFLAATLLGAMRIQSGSILLPSGFLAGCVFVRRVLRKTSLLVFNPTSPAAVWWVPDGDPRSGPVLWVFLGLGIAAVAYWTYRRGEGRIDENQAAWDTNFKRLFPLSNGSMLAPLDVWLPRLWAARWRVGLVYLPRLAAILCFSALNTILSLPERLVLPLIVRRRGIRPPVFIVGVHRSGTTHLHNLLALDPQFTTPRTYQVMNPVGFNFSGWLIAPIFGVFLPWKRPMDSVRFHLWAPQEEEFAVAGLCRLSPYWGLTFPRDGAAYDRFILPERFSPAELSRWKRVYGYLLRKLTLFSRRRLLLKNPYNTGRVALLAEMFPGAKFIHIYRHPFAVCRSNAHMATEGHVINQLQDPDPADNYTTRFLGNYRAMEDAFYRDLGSLAPGQATEVRFEDLERDPIGQIERIYAALGMELTETFRRRLTDYLRTVADYQKNRFRPTPEAERRRILEVMGDYFERWGYTADGGLVEPDAQRRAA